MIRRSALLVCLSSLSACAWTARENRPVWNAFESTCVPESDGAFYAALPLTAPLGLCAILVDTFVAHPLQVVDDAFDDSVDLWRDLDFEHAYYTENALVPLRVVATPIWFAGSFLGRSCFYWPSQEQAAERADRRERDRKRRLLAALRAVAAGRDARALPALTDPVDDEVRAAVAAALAAGNAEGRLAIYVAAGQSSAGLVDWSAALADPSAVVRYRVLDLLPQKQPVSAALQARLREDPDEAVRLRARERFPE